MNPLFSITVEVYANGEIKIWSQQQERLSPDNLEKLKDMMISVRRSACQHAINNEIQFPNTVDKKAS
jgi:hypothetical protein